MPFHPAHPLFVLLESIDPDNEDHLTYFAKENQKFQLQIQDGLLHAHMNRLRIKEGKEPKEVLEIGADDAVPFRIALILDYLSVLPIEQARAYCQKILEISEKLDNALAKAPQSKKDGVIRWGEEQGFLTGLEAAFEAAESYGFKKSDNKDLEEAFITIHDAQTNASKENFFKRILAVDPSNNLAVVDFFQRAEQDLLNAKRLVLGDAITGLDEQLPVLIAFSTGIVLEENIDSAAIQVILDKLMVISDSFLESIRALPNGDMQDRLQEQYAWCFNLSSALSYVIQNNAIEVLRDPKTFEHFAKLYHNKLDVVVQFNTIIRETQRDLDKEHDLKKRLSYQNEDDSIYKQADTTGNTLLHYAMQILAIPLTKEQLNPVLQVIERSLKEGVSLDLENRDAKSPLDLLAEVATGNFKHDIMPKKLFDELKEKGIDLKKPQFEGYSIGSFTEPFIILSERRETTLLAEILNKKNPDNYLSFLQLALMREPDLRSNIADTLLNPNVSGDTVFGNLFKNPASNPAAIAFALQCVDLKDKRFANVVCDEIPIDSPYLDLRDEKFLKKWLNEGLNINHQGEKTGNTLLHKRFQQGDSADVVTLLRQGANPKLKNYEGHTARASKPEHNISIFAIMNYGVRYATKTLNNGVKRLWNGLRGKKEVLPTTLEQAINHSDEKLVVPLEKSEPVVIQEMQQKKGVRFAGDSVESTVLSPESLKSEWKSVQPSHSNSQASLLMRKAITPIASEHKGHKQKKAVVVNAELKVELAPSSAVVASQFCIEQFQQALKELESGRLPSFCQADVSLRVARQACIDIIQKMSILEKAGKVEPTAIRMVAFDVGAGRVLRKENPLSKLRRTLEGMENTSTSKFRPGGRDPASGA
ncbi:hypothetical protein CC99x_009160 [Candidatus Berkiella cookevillensis]|uniref:Uncharacterized protein n=1 Tax=Candidatus Berkiella cookevillensis TaxID=437022 RepID=A0A0Q9YKR9_9GAMM|nr:hypothetical protein [Candidatus Berkiella cookevillensis]MCS5709071.1 hypothetical protein [Candidatus Berkiella cookevillensis]